MSVSPSFHSFGSVLYYCQAHCPQHLSSVPFCPLSKSSPPPSWPAKNTSPKPPTENSLLTSTSNISPSAYLSPLKCGLAGPALASGSGHPPLECPPAEASFLWSLSIPSLREIETCGLCYQCFNFYQYGVWLMMIHGFRPSIQ